MGSVSPEIEIASDTAIRSFMGDSYRRHFGLREMLDNGRDSVKTEAMKRIVNLIATGKDDVSDLFDAVVKNVASKNPELKMLVYIYLARYAEEQQDLALLSISTLQKALKDPNQLIRASALRVLSSIRVPIIVPIMMLVIRESTRDMSPYVRKVAAHAIPKLYLLDNELKSQLVDIVDLLLGDKCTMVFGSAIYAFQELCPERLDLIHKHYRKLCTMLMDMDDWGQIMAINLLTRYARLNFADPSCPAGRASPNESDSSSGEKPIENQKMDADLSLLIKCTKSLLQSRNSAVVLGIAQLYYYIGTEDCVHLIARPLIRLLGCNREVQFVVLSNIASLSSKRAKMFEPFLKSFFVRSTDNAQTKRLKLEILTNIATPTNIGVILSEFQVYVSTYDKQFAADTIEVIGRCACNIEEVRDTCLKGLVKFMSSSNDLVVAESVIVIKNLLQREQIRHREIVVAITKLIDKVNIPAARASILWLVGERCEEIERLAPDVLRKVVRNFVHEEVMVKLQAINLAVKLHLTNPEKTRLLVEHVLNLGRYDQSYDIRDRVRFLRNVLYASSENRFTKIAKQLFFTVKPSAPITGSFVQREELQLGTLSHLLNQRCYLYTDLPPFTNDASDPALRGEPVLQNKEAVEKLELMRRQGMVNSRNSNLEEISGEESISDKEETSSGSSEESEYETDSGEESEQSSDQAGSTESDSGSSSPSDQILATSGAPPVENGQRSESKKQNYVNAKSADYEDLLTGYHLDTITPLVPTASSNINAESKPVDLDFEVVPASYVHPNGKEIVNKLSGRGVTVSLRFTRSPNIHCVEACSVELQFCNQTNKPIESIRFDDKLCALSIAIFGLQSISAISPGQCVSMPIGIQFRDSTQPLSLSMNVDDQPATTISFAAPVGEQLRPVKIDADQFSYIQGRLKGLNENSGQFAFRKHDLHSIESDVLRIANVHPLSADGSTIRFTGQTLSAGNPILILIKVPTNRNQPGTLTVNCENVVIGSMLFKQLKACLV